MKKTNISIPNPCFEDWGSMTKTEMGRFCLSCEKEVVDFSVLDNNAVESILATKPIGQICGRFKTTQLVENSVDQNQQTPYALDLLKVAALLAILPLTDVAIAQTQLLNSNIINIETIELSNTVYPGKDSLKISGSIKDTLNKVAVSYAKIEVKDRSETLVAYSEFNGQFTVNLTEDYWQKNEYLHLEVAAENYEIKQLKFSKDDLEQTLIQDFEVVVIVARKPSIKRTGAVVQRTKGLPVRYPEPIRVNKGARVKAWIFHPFKMMRYRKDRK